MRTSIRDETIQQEEGVDSFKYQVVVNQLVEQQNDIEKQSIVKAMPIHNIRWTNSTKQGRVMWLFYTNPRGFEPDTSEKIEMLKKRVNERKIDGILFSTPDRRWNSIVLRKIKH